MTRNAWTLPFVVAAGLIAAVPASAADSAQQPLNAQQKLGRQLFSQSCMVCHTSPQLGSAMYGPALSKDSGNGDPQVMNGIIRDGTPRMPGFKHQFTAKQIDAIVAYLGTVPKPVVAAAGSTKGGMD